MVAPNCKEYYPDIFTRIPDGEKPDGPTAEQNERRRRLYLAVRHLLRLNFGFDPDDSTTLRPADFPSGFGKRHPKGTTREELLQEETVFFASVYGMLRARGYEDPSLNKPDRRSVGPDDLVVPFPGEDLTIVIANRFIHATTLAVKNYHSNRALFHRVFEVLRDEGEKKLPDGTSESTIHARQIAEITQRLIDDRVQPDDPQIKRFILIALARSLSGHLDGNASDVDIRLPDLDVGTAVDIIDKNVRAVAAIYFSAMLEEMKTHAVMEKCAEHFMIGMLPISRGPAGDKIYRWIKRAPDRFTELERRSIYGRVLGIAHGAVTDILPNREFMDLWLRFLSNVSILARDRRSTAPQLVVGEQVVKSARDLAVNLSLHGYGVAHFAAVEMQNIVHELQDILSQQELLTAYGVNDRWQLVDRVATMYLPGGAANGVRYRTMAAAGSNIILWLARHSATLASTHHIDELLFVDAALVNDVERWLAVTGTPSASVEQYRDPVDLRVQPTIPSFAPTNGASSVVRTALEQAGIGGLPAVPQV